MTELSNQIKSTKLGFQPEEWSGDLNPWNSFSGKNQEPCILDSTNHVLSSRYNMEIRPEVDVLNRLQGHCWEATNSNNFAFGDQ